MACKLELDSTEVSRLREIQQEMLNLLEEAEHIVAIHALVMTAARAKSYWIPEIRIALLKEHDYLAGSMCCMDDTINEMLEDAHSSDESGDEDHNNADDDDNGKG